MQATEAARQSNSQNSKKFRWACWFLGKNLSNFVPPVCKLHNPYCHTTDAACDDENNNAACNFDDGACCGDDVDKTFCTKCECIDPNAWTYSYEITTWMEWKSCFRIKKYTSFLQKSLKISSSCLSFIARLKAQQRQAQLVYNGD